MKLPGRDVPFRDFARALYREITCDNLVDYAGSVAFSAALSLFPFLLFAVALAGLVIDPGTVAKLVDQIRQVMPAEAAELLVERLRALTSGARPGLVTLGALGAVWAASGAVAALITAFNTAWDVPEGRPFWKVRGMAILVTLAGAAAVVIVAALTLVVPEIEHHLGIVGAILGALRWPIAALIMAAILACLYYFLPDVEQDFRFLTPGSLVAVALWIAASLAFSIYVRRFGHYEVVYGALGGVIVLLLWLWISALAILVGAEINAVIEHLSPEGKRAGAKSLADRGEDRPG